MLYATMTMRNEEGRYLKEVLDHLGHITNKIFIYDDRSVDNSVEIARSFGAKVEVRQENDPGFCDHEGGFRQKAWDLFQKTFDPRPERDWVLSIDADELLWESPPPHVNLHRLLGQNFYDVLNIVFYHMWDANHYRVDSAWAPTPSSRLFRYYRGGQYADRKLACGAEPSYVRTLMSRGRYLLGSGLIMQHLGYMRDEDKKAKYDRYMELDGGSFHSISHLQSILDPSPKLEEWKA